MADVDGTLLGEGFTDVKESKLWYLENYFFNRIGAFHIRMIVIFFHDFK